MRWQQHEIKRAPSDPLLKRCVATFDQPLVASLDSARSQQPDRFAKVSRGLVAYHSVVRIGVYGASWTGVLRCKRDHGE
jgi:hypothetical protein